MIRKLETKENVEKKETRNKIIIGVILAILMLLSTAGYSFFNGDKQGSSVIKTRYNGRDFYWQGSYWSTQYSSKTLYFTYLPNETRQITLGKTVLDYQGKTLYYTANSQAMQEAARDLGNFVSRIQIACMQGGNCTENIPIKNCSSNMIVIEEAENQSIVRAEDNCIFITSNDSVRDADSFLYAITGIN